MRVAVVAGVLIIASSAQAQTDAERKAFDRAIRPVEKTGCQEHYSSDNRRSLERVIKACTRALERTSWTDLQRAYAYHVRGEVSAVADKLPEALADLNSAIALNPGYAPSYYERGYVNQRQRAMNQAAADFKKSVELGNKGAEYPLSILTKTCPSLTWNGETCLAAGSTSGASTVSSGVRMYSCGHDVSLPPGCTESTSLFMQGIARLWICPSVVAKPAGCVEPIADAAPKVRYACDAQFNTPPAECTVVSAGAKTRIVDCPESLHPGLGCAHPTPEVLADHPSISPPAAAVPPQVQPPGAADTTAPPAATSDQRTSWFEWRPWRRSGGTAQSPAASSVPAVRPPTAGARPERPFEYWCKPSNMPAVLPAGCEIGAEMEEIGNGSETGRNVACAKPETAALAGCTEVMMSIDLAGDPPPATPSPPAPVPAATSPSPPIVEPAAPAAPAASPAPAGSGRVATIPPGCPIGKDFGGWTVRRGTLEGVPVVTTGTSATYSGTATKWTTEDISFEMIPRKDGKWLPMLLVKNLKHGGTPVREITGHFAVVIWNAATNKIIAGVENKTGGNNMYHEPYTIIGLLPSVIEEAIDKIEASPKINIALDLPKEGGSGLIDVAWIQPFRSNGLRAAMAAAKICAVD